VGFRWTLFAVDEEPKEARGEKRWQANRTAAERLERTCISDLFVAAYGGELLDGPRTTIYWHARRGQMLGTR